MRLIFENYHKLHAVWLCFVLLLKLLHAAADEEGDPCRIQSHSGLCTKASACGHLESAMKELGLSRKDIVSCGYTVFEELICCPQMPVTSTKPRVSDRPAVRACTEIEKSSQPGLTPHILDGTPVELGEYPHMVAIGLQNGLSPTVEFDCGGALIEKRFVLTAAHCLVRRDRKPVVVRMGVTNFTDAEQMRNVVEIGVKKIHVHPDYVSSKVYNDIGLLELDEDVNYEGNPNVFPTCLYTDLEELPDSAVLYVTGWGVVNTRTRDKSNVLLKAKQKITPLDKCNASFIEQGLTRQINVGILSTQLCTSDPGLTKDACQGDSGGPLNLVVDESLNKYRVVGVISAGFSCASATPGLHTRVAAFLDYIESIVWPTST